VKTDTRDFVAELTALIPGHAHVKRDLLGLLGIRWSWTTPDGQWAVTWGGWDETAVATPYGDLRMPGKLAADVRFQRVVGVLRELGAIGTTEVGQ
jgi:hypothetical protein